MSFQLDSGLASNVSSLEALERRDLDQVISQSGGPQLPAGTPSGDIPHCVACSGS